MTVDVVYSISWSGTLKTCLSLCSRLLTFNPMHRLLRVVQSWSINCKSSARGPDSQTNEWYIMSRYSSEEKSCFIFGVCLYFLQILGIVFSLAVDFLEPNRCEQTSNHADPVGYIVYTFPTDCLSASPVAFAHIKWGADDSFLSDADRRCQGLGNEGNELRYLAAFCLHWTPHQTCYHLDNFLWCSYLYPEWSMRSHVRRRLFLFIDSEPTFGFPPKISDVLFLRVPTSLV